MTPARFPIAVAALAAVLALPLPAAGQSAATEARRQAVFAQMIAAPADRALMLEYARLSVQLRDFESAAATLERFLDLEPGNVGARIELAVAYFSLGAYAVAEYHLAAAAGSGALTPEQARQVARYREESTERGDPHQITGRIALGQSWSREQDERGQFATVDLDWRFDMGGPDANDWRTQLAFSRYNPEDIGFSDRQTTRLRSGPEYRLTGDVYGPRLQPYLELTWAEEDFGFGFVERDTTMALGFAYQNPHTAFWTSYADLQIGRGERDFGFGFTADFDFYDVSVGLGFRPSRETRIRGTLRWREEQIEIFANQYEQTRGLRLEALHTFDTGWQVLPRRWEARAWALREMVEEGDDFGIFNEDTDTALGLGLRAFVTDELFVEARGARLERDFNFGIVDQETVYSLQFGWEF